ncbi:TIGR03943 family protein, partial [Streptomyces sp. WAC 05379]
MNRQAQAAVLFLLGASLLHAATTDLYLRYVKQGLRPLVLVSGAVLIAAALATAWYERKRARSRKQAQARARHPGAEHPGARNAHTEHVDAEHAHREPRISWLLVLPLLALI